ncbi:MAG: hypothetical protein UZ01_01545 [Candidatus Brocadia sinica]|uniref:Conserved hypothetical secreted protein n=1 Tax=Candidatus Brocadia sinica JPN1 TaxID=1197129 RepID=A0ABQ0JVG8_9BACT|nr:MULTISPECIES: YMGG-like glycine zipper-containing protein [Brocadia]KXK30072.1 MAG: hypothetical protein UZ01_01545 [Candidatus Brocadia sinica]MCK6468984.1 YMGG-like glycine zipper-containing protein [Candidatus Brocadia sinica]GAN32701.1 conserved hypothetical secreted protein [Candidatus Brocadia sinica JPN1]GIK13765.1 MAG: hypothetical protein BroJett002_24720 [Candidatus Brocadia sinica]GJQ16462.1 MAG: hypothetical protein HBSIN01_04210 [Candidatus Brocadia sinica]
MKRMIYAWGMLFVTTCTMGSVPAQNLIIYPAKGQSQEQMEKDKFECYSWAKQQTGFDPMVVSTQQTPASQGSTGGGAVKGAAKGALVGAGIGAIAGDAGKGAAIGAASGGAFGGLRSRSQRKQAEQVQRQQVSQTNQRISEYNRAYSACLEAKGYTVK